MASSLDDPLEGTSTAFNQEGTIESTLDLEVPPNEAPTAVSLLSRLKPPQPSTLARKRKIPSNPPSGKTYFHPVKIKPSCSDIDDFKLLIAVP